jgi:hypothetical protein
MNKKRYCLWFFSLLLVLGHQGEAKTVMVMSDRMDLRSGPGRTYDIVEMVNKHEKFEVLEEKDGWYKINVEGTIGWISEKAVTVFEDTAIQELLQRADAYFARQQFTTPPEANAFDLYQEVLHRESQNAHALKKIEQMTKIYKTWADNAYQRGEYEKAKLLYQRYLFLIPDDQQVRELLTRSNNPVLNPEAVLNRVHLRTDPITLSADSVVQMIRRYSFNHPADWSKYGLSPSLTGTISHEYERKQSNGVNVVIDYATDLMWQQAGPVQAMTWNNASAYISQLNNEQYASYTDWRLPTLEELTSLLEPTKQKSNLYLTPVFGTNQVWCWSADKDLTTKNVAWYISFSSGGIQQQEIENTAFVLAVRSLQVAGSK